MQEFMGKGVMGMDDGLSDLADLSDLSKLIVDGVLLLKEMPALRVHLILVSPPEAYRPASGWQHDRKAF